MNSGMTDGDVILGWAWPLTYDISGYNRLGCTYTFNDISIMPL